MMDEIKRIYMMSGKTTAVDVFGGSGKFLLNIKAINKVYNDIDSRLVNAFRVLMTKDSELIMKLYVAPRSRELFNESKEVAMDDVTDAFRFIYNRQHSFNGEGDGFAFDVGNNKGREFDLDMLRSVVRNVKKWTIEHLDFKDLIKRYDSDNTFFYLDPPYHDIKLYDNNFSDGQFVELRDAIADIKGAYLLNINDDDFVRETFGDPKMTMSYSNHAQNARVPEYTKRTERDELFYWKGVPELL